MKKTFFRLATCLLVAVAATANAQNLVVNGNFNASGGSWVTACTAIEAYAFETTYGGTVATNRVAEVDDESCFRQDVCVLPGASYVFSMDASRRTAGGPNPVTSHIKIEGLDATSTVVGTYVDMDYTRNNAVFALTPVTGIPVVVVPSGMGVVRVRITLTDNTPGFSTLGTIVDNISLVEAAPPLVSGTDTTCPGIPHTFSVTGVGTTGITYSWSFGASASPVTSTASSPSVSWSTAGTYIATVTLGNGVCMMDTVAYTVYVTSSVAANSYDTTCYGVGYNFGGTVLYNGGTYTDSFVSAGGCDSIITLHLFVRPIPVGNKYDTICAGSSYTFYGNTYTTTGNYVSDTVHTAAGCDSLTILHLQVNPHPATPVVASATYCQYAVPVPLSASGVNLTWYGPGVTSGMATPPTITTATAPVSDTFFVTQTVNGCVSDSARAIIRVIAQPDAPLARDTTYCQFETAAPLSATGSNIRWYTTASGGAYVTTPPVPATTVPGTYTWYVSQVVNGCESNRTMVTVIVLTTPVFHIQALRTSVCQHDTLSLAYAGTPFAGMYLWTLANGQHIVAGDSASPAIVLQLDSAGLQPAILWAGGPGGTCNAVDTIWIQVQPAPTANAHVPENICLFDTVQLALDWRSSNASTFMWAFGGATIITATSGGGGPYKIRFDTVGTRIVAVTPVTEEGCRGETSYDTVNIRALPDADIHVVDGSLKCLEDSVLLAVTKDNVANSYLWGPAHFFVSNTHAEEWARIGAGGYVFVSVSSPFGCVATDSILFNPEACCNVYFPTAFTPNGKNKVFRPIYSGYHRFSNFRVYNRWGQTVYESTTSEMAWDGRFNGEPQDMGVYYYFIKYDCGGESRVTRGEVTLIR